ncbi:Nucleobase-ascorbate transporter 2-like protein [Drosera capensis]
MAAAGAPKPEEMSHPAMDQLQGLDYCIDSNPSWGETVALGFQHYILALGTAVMIPSFLVPWMGGTHEDKAKVVQTMLFVQGINTLLQTLFGTRLPAVIGGSYAYMIPIVSIINDPSLAGIESPSLRFRNTMKAVQGSMIVASSIQVILGYSQLWAICSRFFSPLAMAPVIALAGFGLFERGFPMYLKHIQLKKQLPILERFALILSIAVIWAYAHILTTSGAYKHRPEKIQISCRTDMANLISGASWIRVPYPLQWGAPSLSADHAFGMMAAVMVSLIESTGGYKAAARFASATPPPAHVISRGIGWQGMVTEWTLRNVEWLFGVHATRKFGALFASIPFPIFAAVYCVLFGLVGSVGLSFLQFTNMNSLRNLFITGVALFLGLSVPEYFMDYTRSTLHGPAHTRAGWFNDFLNTIFSSPPTVALILAVFLDNTLDVKDSAKDRGMPWWAKFRTFKGDSRNDEFYTLPFNLNRFFPPS